MKLILAVGGGFLAALVLLALLLPPTEYKRRWDAYVKAHPQGVNLGDVFYKASSPPSAEDMEFAVWRNNPGARLYDNVAGACYREGKVQVTFVDANGARQQRLFSEIAGEDADIIFNVPKGRLGWLLYYQTSFAHPSLVGLPGRDIFGIVLHLPAGSAVKNCE
ncbi:MAG: hypothetical protein M1383_01360 [Patescibacteria group bacterium]|nr:hypothetical protein [Patescibacteria group bacterium]